eukprot:SAG11_NODE_28112_length_325_cov_0.911504_1_plen_75_part_01
MVKKSRCLYENCDFATHLPFVRLRVKVVVVCVVFLTGEVPQHLKRLALALRHTKELVHTTLHLHIMQRAVALMNV